MRCASYGTRQAELGPAYKHRLKGDGFGFLDVKCMKNEERLLKESE